MNQQHEWVQPIVQLATSGGFAALAWYLLIKGLPAVVASFREESKEARTAFSHAMECQSSQCKEELQHLSAFYEKQLDRVSKFQPPH